MSTNSATAHWCQCTISLVLRHPQWSDGQLAATSATHSYTTFSAHHPTTHTYIIPSAPVRYVGKNIEIKTYSSCKCCPGGREVNMKAQGQLSFGCSLVGMRLGCWFR